MGNSFGQDLNEVRPRTPLLLFEMKPYAATVAMFNDMIRREFVRPIRETLAYGPTLLFGEDPQQRLFES